jgi:integrase
MAARSSIAKTAAAKDTPERPYEVRADAPKGLLLRVQPSGLRTYYVEVWRGKRIKIGNADTWTLEKAKRRATDILLDPDTALAAIAKKKVLQAGDTLDDYIDEHYNPHAMARLKDGERTIKRLKATWAPLLTKKPHEITVQMVDKLRDSRVIDGVEPATVNRDLNTLRSVLAHWAKATGNPNPLHGIKPLKVADDEVIRYLTPDEEKRLRQALAERDRIAAEERRSANEWRRARGRELMPEITGYSDHLTPMVLLSINTGLRQGEMFAATWEQVDLERRTLTVLASHAKGNATRVIPLNDEALQLLKAIKPEKAAGLLFPSPKTGERFDNIKKGWAELTKKAELEDVRWHDLRHHFASTLVMRGVSLYVVQKLLGHATPKMTMRYAKLAPGALADAVAVLGAPA